jgi:hypothetical protein
MPRFASLLLFIALARPAVAEDFILVERGSPGLVPAMGWSYVSRYSGNLEFLASPLAFPLLSESPSAALMVGEALFVGEGNCSPCVPRLVRHDPAGTSFAFAPVLGSVPRSIRLSTRGDLVVTTQSEVVRFDRASGAAVATYDLAIPDGSFVSDTDVDPSGCRIAIAMFPDILAYGTICGPPSAWKTVRLPTVPPNTLKGVRYLHDGTLLASAKSIYHLDLDGHLIRKYESGQDTSCLLDVDRSGGEAVLACGLYLLRLDLESGEVSARVQIRHGIAVGCITTIEPETPAIPPRGHRRSVGH